MGDFEKKIYADVLVEVVNLSRATVNEAATFKEILSADIITRFRKIVVDISRCEFMDSTFLGTLVLAQKQLSTLGGEIKLVEPASVMQTLMEKVQTLKIFDTYKTVEEAVHSFKYGTKSVARHPLQEQI